MTCRCLRQDCLDYISNLAVRNYELYKTQTQAIPSHLLEMFRITSATSLNRRRTNASHLSQVASVVEREERALAELKDLCHKNSATWPKSELVPEDASGDNFEEPILL